MNWKVKFQRGKYDELHQYLFDVSPSENGCFLLANSTGKLLLITSIIYPKEDNWLDIGEGRCVPSSAYLSYAANKADQEGKALLFVHSHPRDFHPSTFSAIDVISNEKMFRNLTEIVEKPLASLVFSTKGIHGVVYANSEYQTISDYSILGRTIDFNLDTIREQGEFDEDELSRQILFMKKSGVECLTNLNIAIIGLGGIGSPLAVMLAKMGVKRMSFFDGDRVEKHNLPRIHGATKSSTGSYKAKVVKDFIMTFSDAEILVNLKMLNHPNELESFDLIFGCVDNHSARDIMNTASFKYAIPLIDSACAIPQNDNGKVEQSVMVVNTVMPGSACLWCSKTLNAIKIMEDSLSQDELAQRQKDGYLMKVTEAPSVISLTSAVASMAINRMLNLIGIYSDTYSNRVVFDFSSTLLNESSFKKSEKCVCSTKNAFGC
ncbi:MAG: ThiF family adenylyltransferase [Cryomorphaceae bacterium]